MRETNHDVPDAAQKIIASADSSGEIITGDDGFAIFWPKAPGAFTAWTLRVLADELDRRNADWEAHIANYFGGKDMGVESEESVAPSSGIIRVGDTFTIAASPFVLRKWWQIWKPKFTKVKQPVLMMFRVVE